jgi:hypothetical protein
VATQITKRYFREENKTRFCQGDILHDIQVAFASDIKAESDGKEYEFSVKNLLFGVVINQECDLEHDFSCRNGGSGALDKYLPNILILPAYPVEDFKKGIHREGIKAVEWGGDKFKDIMKNQNSRFHHINQNLDVQIPDLIIDFKHLYTVSSKILYKKIEDNYLASIGEIFREELSIRYCNYLGRIGLPEIN